MEYIIDKTSLRAAIDEEVSRVADEAYGDNGASLYDTIILTSKDDAMVDRLIDDAFDLIARRLYDVCKFFNDTLGQSGLYFYLPDFDETMWDAVEKELNRFITLFVCASVFQSRRASLVPVYTDQAQAAIDKAVFLLKSRKSPITIW